MSEIIINVDPEDVPNVIITVDENSAQVAKDAAAAAQEALEEIRNTDFSDKLDKGTYTGNAQNLNARILDLELPDGLIKIGIIDQTGSSVTVAANEFGVRADQVEVFNPAFSETINSATDLYSRIDIFEIATTGIIYVKQGDEDIEIAKKPDPTAGRYEIGLININGSTISPPTTTPGGSSYVAKDEFSFQKIQGSGAKAAVTVSGDSASFRFMAASSVSSISVAANNKKYIYDGKDHFVKNENGGTLTIKHNAGTGNFKYFLPNETDLILENNEIVNFKFRFTSGNTGFLDYVGKVAADVDLSNYYTKTEADDLLDLKLDASAYNDRFKGVYLTEAALNAAHPTANVGDYAQVNEVGATDVVNYNWDGEESIWVKNVTEGGSGATNTDALPEGTTNLYWTTSRGLALVLSGLSSASGTFTASDTLIAAFGKIKYLIDNIATTYQVILTDLNFGTFINSLTAKTTPVDADSISIVDSSDSNKQKKVSWANVKVALVDYFNNIYSKGSNFIFSAKGVFRAWQGIGVFDNNYIYAFSDRNESFSLNNSIQKYDHKGNFISEVTSAYTQTDPGGKFMSFGSLMSDDGTYYIIPVYNYNGGGSPLISRIARFNKTTLAYVDQISIGGNVAEAAFLYLGEWYVCYFDIMKIRKFNTSWVLQTEYDLSPTLKPNGGYQSLFFKNGFWYMNWHGSNNYSGTYTPGLDKYSFNGSAFTYVETIQSPTYGSGQGVLEYNDKYYWIDRPQNAIVIIDKLGDIVAEKISPRFKKITLEDPTLPILNSSEINLSTFYKTIIGSLQEYQVSRISGPSTNMAFRLNGGVAGDTQIIHASNNVNKFLTGYDEDPISGYRIYHYGFSKPILFAPVANDYIGLNGVTDPKSKLEIGGGIKIANDSDAASVNKVGTIRYRTSGNNSYVDVCMQIGASTYAWINISTQSW